MNGQSTITKTKIKTSTKAAIGLLALGSVAAGLVFFTQRKAPTPTTLTSSTTDPACTDANWSSSLSPTPCPSSGTQTKTWTKIGACTGGVTHPSTEIVTCTYALVPPIVCTETDGGNNIYQVGKTSLQDSNNVIVDSNDYCFDQTTIIGTKITLLKEFFCNSTSTMAASSSTCPAGTVCGFGQCSATQ
jgi:hypothetical protein